MNASVPATCPTKATTATAPGRRYKAIINTAMNANAIIPATTIASSAPEPRLGEIVEKLAVTSLKGSAPELILSARAFASSASKFPVIEARPSVIAV